MTKDQFVVFCSDTMETCSNMKFNIKLLDPEVLVQYNPGFWLILGTLPYPENRQYFPICENLWSYLNKILHFFLSIFVQIGKAIVM